MNSKSEIASVLIASALMSGGSVMPERRTSSFKGVIMANSIYAKRKKRNRMAKKSRSINRKK